MGVDVSYYFFLGGVVVGFDRGGVGVDYLGDGVVVHVVVIPQVEGELLLWREREDGSLKQNGFGVGIVAVFVGYEAVDGGAVVGVVDGDGAILVALLQAKRFVGGDAEDPCVKRQVAVEVTDVAENAEESFLQGILGIVVEHGDAAYVPIDRLFIFLQEEAEAGLRVAVDGAKYVVVVGCGHAAVVVKLNL